MVYYGIALLHSLEASQGVMWASINNPHASLALSTVRHTLLLPHNHIFTSTIALTLSLLLILIPLWIFSVPSTVSPSFLTEFFLDLSLVATLSRPATRLDHFLRIYQM